MIGLNNNINSLSFNHTNSLSELTEDKDTSQVDSGSLSSILRKEIKDKNENNNQGYAATLLEAPIEKVTLKEVDDALNRIFSEFKIKNNTIDIANVENTSMDVMALAASLLSIKSFGDTANLKAIALEIRSKGADELRLKQNEDLRKQIDKAIEDHNKTHKSDVFAVIVDWATSAADIISGVANIVIGNYAGGAMDLAAGSAGLVCAMCKTLAMIDTGNADQYNQVAEVAGKVQLAFELAGMMVDVVSLARGVVASKSIAKATETVMKQGAGELIENTIKQVTDTASKEVAKDIIKDISKQVASEVSGQMASQIAKNLAEQSTRFMGQGHLLKAFSSQAIENMISSSIEKVAIKALQSAAETTAEEITTQVVKELQREIVRAAVGATIRSVPNMVKSATRAGLEGTNDIFKAAIDMERAELQKVIQMLINDTSFCQFLLDEFEQIKKRTQEDMSNLLDNAGQTLSSASESQLKTNAVLSRISTNIA